MLEAQLQKFAQSMMPGAPPIRVAHPAIGDMGWVSRKQGFKVNGMSRTAFEALSKDQVSVTTSFSWTKRFLGKKFFEEGAERRHIRRLLRKERGTIATWDDVLSARCALQAEDTVYFKELATALTFPRTLHYFRLPGNPGAGSYTNISGGAVLNNASTGAWPITNPPSGSKWLTTFGSGSIFNGMAVLTDLLVAAGNIDATVTTSQTVNTVALTRYTGTASAGNVISLEVTATMGASGSSASTITYTNQAGTASRTSTPTIVQQNVAYSMNSIDGTFMLPLQAGDTGVRSIQSIQINTTVGGGTLAIMIHRPLMVIPQILYNWAERGGGQLLGGITNLPVGTDSALGCLSVMMLSSTSPLSPYIAMIRTIYG